MIRAAVFKISDTVWYAQAGMTSVRKPCRVCFGKLYVTVILGDESLVDVRCSYCSDGYEDPRGYETVYEWAAEAHSDYVAEVRITRTGDGERYEYRFGSGRVMSDVFATQAEAMVVAEELAREHEAQEEARRKHGKEQAEKSFAWHVGYHQKQIKDATRTLAYANSRIQACKDAGRIERASKRQAKAAAK